MLINALQKADEKQFAELTSWLAQKNADPDKKVAAVTALYDEIGIKALCDAKINSYFDEAKQCLDKVALSDEQKACLWDFAMQLLERKS